MPPIIWHDLREPTHPSSEAEPRSLVSISLRRSRAVPIIAPLFNSQRAKPAGKQVNPAAEQAYAQGKRLRYSSQPAQAIPFYDRAIE
jgi:hypothetical protein